MDRTVSSVRTEPMKSLCEKNGRAAVEDRRMMGDEDRGQVSQKVLRQMCPVLPVLTSSDRSPPAVTSFIVVSLSRVFFISVVETVEVTHLHRTPLFRLWGQCTCGTGREGGSQEERVGECVWLCWYVGSGGGRRSDR